MKIMYVIKGLLIINCCIIFGINSSAQTQPQDTTNVDDMFQKARNLAFNGKRAEARKICYEILKKHPDYYDVRVLLGRTFEWDSKPDSARLELNKVVKKEYYEDAYSAMADLETWENRPDSALLYLNELLKHNPNNVNYLLKKARLLIKKGDEKGAIDILNQILDNIEPANKEAKDLLASLKFAKMLNRIAVSWANEYFDGSSFFNADWKRNWNVYSVEYGHRFHFGNVYFRTNLGTFNDDPTISKQFEVDAYPGITKHDYLYLNYGYAPGDDYFPRHRFGIELYHSFSHAIEASAGLRYLQFYGLSNVSNVFIYTASVGKYVGNYWFDLRAFITPDRDLSKTSGKISKNTSMSFLFIARKYFLTSNDYLSLSIGAGASPKKYENSDIIEVDNRQSITLGYQRVIHRIFLGGSIGIVHEQYSKDPSIYRKELDTSLKVGYYF
jgi:YaiO family outer membrane protein